MNKTLLLTTLLLAGATFAQVAPSASLTDLKPTDGEIFTYTKTSYLAVTGNGANQTWDFSSVTTVGNPYTITANLVDNSSTELYLEENGARTYYTYTSDGIYLTSITIPGINGINFSNTMQILPIPLEENAVSDDSYTSAQNMNGQTVGQSGNYKAEYHGYGTLITPQGTFNNVICVKISQTYINSLNGTQSGTGYNSGYHWFKPGVHQHIFRMGESGTNTGGSQGGLMMELSTLDIEKMNKMAFIVAPNPATDGFTIAGDNSVKSVQLFDLNGKEISVSYNAATNFVDISSIPTGVYHLQVMTEAGIATQKVVKR